MRKVPLIFLVVACLFSFSLVGAQTAAVIFKNVNIVDVKEGVVRTAQNVLVQGGRIKNISSKSLSVLETIIFGDSFK